MGRMNSAFYLHDRLNLPTSFKKQIDSLLFGSTTLSLSQRLENGFKKIVLTHTLLLSLFLIIFWLNLNPVDSVSNLIAEGMIPDPRLSEYSEVRFFLKHQQIILFFLIITPIAGLAITKAINILTL